MDSFKLITFVTGNPKKLEEVEAILEPYLSQKIISKNIDLPEYQGTPHEICTEKCREAYRKMGGPVIVEDTSLCFNALGGMPGPYIKWFLSALGPDGLPRLLLDFNDKTASAICIFGYAESQENIQQFEGRTDGQKVFPRGTNDFRWDPIFLPDQHSKTYGEMNHDEKNMISHRSGALRKLKEFVLKL